MKSQSGYALQGGFYIDNAGEIRDRNDQTAQEWLSLLFEFEDCDECGCGADRHQAIPVMGNWFARCDHAGEK